MLFMLLITNAGTPIAYSIDYDEVKNDIGDFNEENPVDNWDLTGGGDSLNDLISDGNGTPWDTGDETNSETQWNEDGENQWDEEIENETESDQQEKTDDNFPVDVENWNWWDNEEWDWWEDENQNWLEINETQWWEDNQLEDDQWNTESWNWWDDVNTNTWNGWWQENNEDTQNETQNWWQWNTDNWEEINSNESENVDNENIEDEKQEDIKDNIEENNEEENPETTEEEKQEEIEEENQEEETPEEDIKPEIDWDDLNTIEISGESWYNWINVSVIAWPQTFPKWTYLKIDPVEWDTLYNIRQQISKDDIDIVAFNIRFLFDLESWETKELQPYTWKTVEVSFDYSGNEDFQQANSKELKVYHIKDKETTQNVDTSTVPENEEDQTMNFSKGKRWVKKAQNLSMTRSSVSDTKDINEITQVTKDITNWKMTIQADSFSIYAIIKTNIPDSVLVHYNAWNGKFSWDIQNVDITYNLVNWEYIANAAAQQPNQTWYMFNGWYTNTDCETRWDGIVDDTTSNEISVYACYLSFLDKVFTFGDVSFTIMDRNLWAENTWAYWYYYQWWNNYWFWWSQFTPAISTDLVQTNTYNNQPRWPWNYYSSSNFISRSSSPYRWENTRNDNLWWWNSWEVDRQWPCPDGYHVPLYQEWKAAYDSYIKDWWTSINFASSLWLPLAWYRNANWWGISNDWLLWWYWTSKAYDWDKAYALTFTQDSITVTDNKYRSYANSVRCFKNTDEVTITFDSNGGDEIESQTFKRYEARTLTLKPIPTKEWDEWFAGWFTDSWLTQEFVWANNKYVSSDTTLYAKWWCQPWYVSSWDTCVLRKVTVNYMIWEDLYKTMVYARNNSGHYLPTTTNFIIPQKEWDWMFDQWYLDSEFTQLWKFPMDNDWLGENITVYGKFLPFEEKTITIWDLQVVMMDRNLWAIEASSWYDDANTQNIWYYYQYGNNYGFPNTGIWENTTNQKVTNPISTSWSYTNPYSNWLFVIASPWWTNSYTSLWWWYSAHDNPDNYKIWPCPEWYHIPESNEWKKLYDLVIANKADYTECNWVSNSICFAKVTWLPFGGWRSSSNSNPTTWSTVYYAASSYNGYFQWYTFQMTASAWSTTSWGGVSAFPVRCFKDTERYTLTFDAMWWSNPTYQRIWWWKPYSAVSSTRYGSVFSGWYLDTWYTEQFTWYVDQTRTVYAKRDCLDWFVMDENGECVTDQYISVTYVANPSEFSAWHFPDWTTQKTLEYKWMSAGYFAAVDEEIQVPEFGRVWETWYMFEWWYTDTSYAITSRWTWLSASTTYNSITLYARYLPFKDKTITWWWATFTIMDRNLWALDFSSGYSYWSSNSESTAYWSDNIRTKIWNYYQWWNNFWFPNRTHAAWANWTTAAYPNNVLNTFVENISWRTRWPWNNYFNGTFIRRSESPWYRNSWSKAYENLWWWSSANNPDTDRQWPCPEWYHVPYTTEWLATKNLFDKRALTEAWSTYCSSLTNSAIQYCMPAALGLPFAGYRDYSSAGVSNQGTNAYYWSSTACSADNAYYLYFRSAGLGPQNGIRRSYGFSVRCFKNSPTLTLSFDSNWGSSVASQTNFRRWQARSSKPTNPTRANSTFVWWFLDSELTEAFTFSSTTYVSENTTLYAKWTCKDGYNLSADGQRCEWASIVTFNATTNGGSTSRPMAAFRPWDTVDLSSFTATKPGWTFVWWNTNQNAKVDMGDFTIWESNVTLYAIYKKDVTVTFDPNWNDSQTLNWNTDTGFVVSSCTMRNKDTSCTIKTPTINSINTPTILWYSTSWDVHIATYWEDTNILVSDDVRLYAQSIAPAINRTITFNPNGNISFTYSWDTQSIAKTYAWCTIPATYNGVTQDNYCSTDITFPEITPSSGKTVLWWSTWANYIENLIDTWSTHTLIFDKNLSYYAQSQSDWKNFSVTFYGNWALVNWESSFQTWCSIEAEYNWWIQATWCTVQVPSISRDGFTILWFNNHEDDTTAIISPSTTEITLSWDVSYYVISQRPVFVTFFRNGNDSILLSGESIASTWNFELESCTIRNSATSCTITTPKINSVNTPTILWWSTWADVHDVVVWQNQSLSLSWNADFYAQSKKAKIDFFMTFYINWNDSYTYHGTTYTEDSTHDLCTIPATYNGVVQSWSCSKEDTLPSITAPSNTPTILWRSDGNTNYNPIYSWWQSTTITASWDIDLFAQTTASSVTLTGTFAKSTGIESISYNNYSCIIDAIYNWNGWENQKDYCSVVFPSFVVKTWYENPLWNSSLGNQNANTTLSLPITTNTAFTISASAIEYTISYTLNGGTQSWAKTSYTIADPTFTLVNPTKKWYTFLGWTWSNGNTPETTVTITNWTYGNLSYVASWSMDTYSITYYLDDWVVDWTNPVEYTVDTPNFTLINPTKTWYNFGWWTWSNGNTPTTYLTVRKWTVWDLVYYAKWLPKDGVPYTVYHYLKDPWLSTYTLYDTEEFSWVTDSTIVLWDFAKDDIPCVVYTWWSLVYSEYWLTSPEINTTISPDWSRKIYLYYTRKIWRVTLTKDGGIDSVEGDGEYECGQEVSIEGIPKEWYHFKIWDGEIQDSW